MVVVDPQRKARFIKHSVPLTVVISLICPVSGGLRAQEIEKTASEINRSEFSRDSSLLQTSPVSIENPEPTAIAPSHPPSSLEIIPPSSEKYSLTTLDVDRLSVQTLAQVNKNPLIIAQQTSTPDLAPNPTSQELLTQSNQTPKKNNDTTKSPSDSTLNSPEFPVRFYAGPDFFHRTYGERVPENPDFKSNEFGTLYGLQANLDYVKGNAVYFGLGFRYGGGQTKYDGGIQFQNADKTVSSVSSKSTTNNQFVNIEGRLGYTFQVGKPKNRFLLSPFLALGYHQWNRDISGENTLSSGEQVTIANTREKYSWGYVGPGFHAEYKVSRKFRIGLNAKLMFMFGGDISFVSNQDRGNLGNDLQYEVELPLTYNIVENSKNAVDLKLIPYYRSQDIARGPLSVSGERFEPASITSVWGATFGVQFRF
jgi:hypothetical protein